MHERTTAAGQRVTIEKPVWEVDSIVRHLLLSPETEAVFETYQNQVYKSMILRQAERLVNVCVAPPRPSPGSRVPPRALSPPSGSLTPPLPPVPPGSRDTGEVDAAAARELLNTMRHFDDHKGRVSNLSNKRRRVQSGLGDG